MGPKDAPCEHPSPAKAFAPAPSAFALPRPRSHFPRPRSHFPRIAFHFPRGAIGLPQQQLSTMGYPRKSYPHCCSPPCAKRSRPRACARVYIIYRSPSRRSPGVFAPLRKRVRAVVPPCPAPPCAGWGGRRQRRTPPRTATRPCLPTAAPPPSKWAPRLRRREGKRPNGAPPHHNAHTPNAARKRYLHNSRTMTQRRTKRCAQFVFFVFTPCKLLHNFSTVLYISPVKTSSAHRFFVRCAENLCFTLFFCPAVVKKHPETPQGSG